MQLTTYIPKPDDWNSLGKINGHLTWFAIKHEAEVLIFRNKQHSETYYFEKCARISFRPNGDKQEIHIVPENALTKRVAVA